MLINLPSMKTRNAYLETTFTVWTETVLTITLNVKTGAWLTATVEDLQLTVDATLKVSLVQATS